MRYLWTGVAAVIALALCGALRLPPLVSLLVAVGVPLATWRWGPR